VCGYVDSYSETKAKSIIMKDTFKLRFDKEVQECVLIKVNETLKLYKIANTSLLDLDEDERQDLTEVVAFQQVPIS
jgi:hypothetical protein